MSVSLFFILILLLFPASSQLFRLLMLLDFKFYFSSAFWYVIIVFRTLNLMHFQKKQQQSKCMASKTIMILLVLPLYNCLWFGLGFFLNFYFFSLHSFASIDEHWLHPVTNCWIIHKKKINETINLCVAYRIV